MSSSHILTLREYVPMRFTLEQLPENAARQLHREYGRKVEVTTPPFNAGRCWELRSLGWVGTIPLGPELRLVLEPKIPLKNLFSMLEYAFNLDVTYLSKMTACATVEEFYERLALLLARKVLNRSRRGLYRSYIPREEMLPTLRGRLNVERHITTPGGPLLHCQYQEHTSDNEENGIIAWTLHTIARNSLCGHRALPLVRRASHVMQNFTPLRPYTAHDCAGRIYNRLNDDYSPIHALCRFFLEGIGPLHQRGDRGMLPFLVDMATLFERFVAQWLERHLPADLRIRAQERVVVSKEMAVKFVIDLVLYDRENGTVLAVLDTKYKVPTSRSNPDIYQVLAYAIRMRCKEALLVYPTPIAAPLDIIIGDVRIRSVVFDLANDLEAAGRRFISVLQDRQ